MAGLVSCHVTLGASGRLSPKESQVVSQASTAQGSAKLPFCLPKLASLMGLQTCWLCFGREAAMAVPGYVLSPDF